jgi:hypothetical protein
MPNSVGARYPEGFKAKAVQLAPSSPKKSIRQNPPMSFTSQTRFYATASSKQRSPAASDRAEPSKSARS